jgi:hypothetical protein
MEYDWNICFFSNFAQTQNKQEFTKRNSIGEYTGVYCIQHSAPHPKGINKPVFTFLRSSPY